MPLRPSTLLTASTRISRTLTSTAQRNFTPATFHRRTMATTGTPSETAQAQTDTQSSSGAPAGSHTFSSLDIKNTNINTAPDVKLSEQQKVTVGSVLDLFEGHPTLPKFSLWSPDATFTDNITIATGYAKYTAQFYGLPALFKPIQLQHHRVTSAGNPLEIEMSNKYVVKGIKKEQVMTSVVRIFVDEASGKIERVEDRWNGTLPQGAISDAFRKLNAVTVPAFVKVPKNEEEDLKMKAEREKS